MRRLVRRGCVAPHNRSSHMPAEAVPVIAVVVAVFATFMVVVGGVSIWTNLGDGRDQG